MVNGKILRMDMFFSASILRYFVPPISSFLVSMSTVGRVVDKSWQP